MPRLGDGDREGKMDLEILCTWVKEVSVPGESQFLCEIAWMIGKGLTHLN